MRSGASHEAPQHSADSARLQRPVLGAGKPLPAGLRTQMEARLGADFGRVRIHDQPRDQQLAQQHLAQAFTFGNHIAFNRGRYAPQGADGQRLLAHELAHVVQQRRGGATPPAVEGGPLERAADQAASAVVAGSGPVQVAGGSAVGIARQPLPQEEQYGPPPPRSLSISLVKNEDALPDAALRREVGLIQAWLEFHPDSSERDHLAAELNLLLAEDLARTGRRSAQAAGKTKPKEGSMASLTGIVRKGRLEADEAAAAQRVYQQTGKVPQTTTPFSWAEIKLGTPMSRGQRYDLMVKLQGKEHPVVSDVHQDVRDPEFLTQDEFKQEFWARVEKEVQDCRDEYIRPGPEYRCIEAVNAKYGGPGYTEWREDQYRRTYALYVQAQQKIDAVKYGGPVSLGGRVIGYGLGAATGNDALKWSEHGAALGSVGDIFAPAYAAHTQRTPMRSYNAGAGLEVRRDASTYQSTLPAKPAGSTSVGQGSRLQSTPAAGTETAAPIQPARSQRSSQDPASFGDASFDALIRDLRNSPLGHRLEASKRATPEPLREDTARTRAQVDTVAHTQARDNPPPGQVPGAQIQHDTKTLDVTRNLPAGMNSLHPDVINENLRWLQSRRNLPATELHVDPAGGGTRYFADTVPRGRAGDTGMRGEQLDLFPATRPPGRSYSTEHKFADAFLIPAQAEKIAQARQTAGLPPLDPRRLAIAAGEMARWLTTGHSGTQRSGRNIDLAAAASQRPATVTPQPPPAQQSLVPLFDLLLSLAKRKD